MLLLPELDDELLPAAAGVARDMGRRSVVRLEVASRRVIEDLSYHPSFLWV